MEDDNFETWKEMVRGIGRELMKQDRRFKEEFQKFAVEKYVMEAMVRPYFGDSNPAYSFWLTCINGACEL